RHVSRSRSSSAKAICSFWRLVRYDANSAASTVVSASTPMSTSRIFCLTPNFMADRKCSFRGIAAVAGEFCVDAIGRFAERLLHVGTLDDLAHRGGKRSADRAVSRRLRSGHAETRLELVGEHVQLPALP